MNFALIFRLIGHVLFLEGLLMALPLAVSAFYGGEDLLSFAATIFLVIAAGQLLRRLEPKVQTFRSRDGFLCVALSWVLLAFFGALPFYFSGYFASFIDCFFEAVSGFTTTGASILPEIESLPKGILFWRSFTHWIGGMGVLVFVLAVMPNVSASTLHLLKAESPGPSPGKIMPRIRETAQMLYLIYFGLTIAHIICLLLAGLPLYDAVITSMGSAGTGGFSNRNLSIGAYNSVAVEMITAVFMMLFGVNFSIYYCCLKKDFRSVAKNEELRLYLTIIVVVTILIAINILSLFDFSVFQSLRYSFFQVVSIMTTTGYSSIDFNLWPTFSKALLVTLMVIGASAGSTGGGVKVVRILVLCKAAMHEIGKIIYPRRVRTVKNDGYTVDEAGLRSIGLFFFCYMMIAFVAFLLISLDGFDLITSGTAVFSALGNIGPGFEVIGPMGNWSAFSPFSKLVFSFCMLAGRLEVFPMLLLLSPIAWKRSEI